MKVPQCASSFLSNTVGNQIKRNVDDVNCDKMIDRQSRRQRITDEGAAEVTKGGNDVAQSKNK